MKSSTKADRDDFIKAMSTLHPQGVHLSPTREVPAQIETVDQFVDHTLYGESMEDVFRFVFQMMLNRGVFQDVEDLLEQWQAWQLAHKLSGV